jgi:tetratricopeptide (TPR) repeat protein
MKYLVSITLLLTPLILFSQNYYLRGKEYYNSGTNDSLALELFTKAIELSDHTAESYMLRGAIKMYKGDLQGAETDLLISEKLNPLDADIYYYKGNLFITTERYDLSLESYNKAIELNDKDADIFGARAILRVSQKNYVEAIDDLNQAIVLDSSKSDFYNNRGTCLMLINKFDLALGDLNKAIELGNHEAFGNLGILFCKMGNYEESIEILSLAILNDPVAERYKYYRAISYINIGKFDLACFDLQGVSEEAFPDIQNDKKRCCYK